MTKQVLIQHLVTEGRILFPGAEAIILWGGAMKRDEIAPYGDVDVLIVLPAATSFLSQGTITRLQQYRSIFASGTIDVDPFITNATQLAAGPLRFAGPSGEYRPHELIRHQIKYDSAVIWGHEKTKGLIKPVPLNAALSDIVPKVLTHGVQRIRVEYPAAGDPLAYIAENRNALLIIARTIYALREGKLATKEDAVAYVKRTYPQLRLFSDLLLELYIGNRILPGSGPCYIPSAEEMEDFLVAGETLIRCFLAAKPTSRRVQRPTD